MYKDGLDFEDSVPLGKLNDPTQVHDRNFVRDVANDRKIVRDEEVTQAKLILQIEKQIDDLRLDTHVEC